MATVGEQWLIRCRKIHMTWGTLETTTTCRLLLYTTLTGTPLRRTGPLLSLLRNIIFPAYATQTYIYNGFSHGEAFQSIFSLALQELHMRFLSLIQKNQSCASHYGSTFQAVLHLQRNRPISEFSQYLSRPWPPSGSPLRCYASG